jgi:predicted RNase H-like nuclease
MCIARLGGIDGCPAGWICIQQDAGGVLSSRILSRFSDITDNLPDVVCIDIPIGLTDCGPRDCDTQVRKLLKKRGSRVFPAPIRAAVVATSYNAACETSRSVQNKSISKQAFMIYDKILEVDETLRSDPDLRKRVFEIHPELSFYGMNQNRPMEYPKRDSQGASARQQLIAAHFGPDAFQDVRDQHRRTAVRDDDICDAFAALWTAQRIARGGAVREPDPPPTDAQGLPMCMWY